MSMLPFIPPSHPACRRGCTFCCKGAECACAHRPARDVQVPLKDGQATFSIVSNEVHSDLMHEAEAKLQMPHKLGGLASPGHILLLPGSYSLEVIYPGDANYASATASLPFIVDITCAIADLSLAV